MVGVKLVDQHHGRMPQQPSQKSGMAKGCCSLFWRHGIHLFKILQPVLAAFVFRKVTGIGFVAEQCQAEASYLEAVGKQLLCYVLISSHDLMLPVSHDMI